MSVAFMSSGGMDRAFSPHRIDRPVNLGRWPRLVWQRAFGPECRRANGASSYQPGASPQEPNRRIKPRAESPIQRIAGYEGGHHFRGGTKLITDGMGRAFSPRECGSLAIPGARPQAGMALGLWPSKPRSNPRRSRAGLQRFAVDVRSTSSAPTAHRHTSLGHRPRIVTPQTFQGPKARPIPARVNGPRLGHRPRIVTPQTFQGPTARPIPARVNGPRLGHRPRTCPQKPHEG
jgi:hypothetical protein